MKKNNALLTAAVALLLVIAFSACERNDRLANRLSSGSGIWNIDEIEHIYYDTTGAVAVDTSQHNLGEIIFFDSPTLDALFDYNACTISSLDANGHYHATPCEFFMDGNRFEIRDAGAFYSKVYTVEKWNGGTLVVNFVQAFNNYPGVSDISYKMVLTLKKK